MTIEHIYYRTESSLPDTNAEMIDKLNSNFSELENKYSFDGPIIVGSLLSGVDITTVTIGGDADVPLLIETDAVAGTAIELANDATGSYLIVVPGVNQSGIEGGFGIYDIGNEDYRFTIDSEGNAVFYGDLNVVGSLVAPFQNTYESMIVFNTSLGHHHTGSDSTKVLYSDLSLIPSTFTPAAHNQAASTVDVGSFQSGVYYFPGDTIFGAPYLSGHDATDLTVVGANDVPVWIETTHSMGTGITLYNYHSGETGGKFLIAAAGPSNSPAGGFFIYDAKATGGGLRLTINSAGLVTIPGALTVSGTLTASLPWSSITSPPSTYAPSAHNHAASDTNSGTFDAARIPDLSGTYSVTSHNHSGVYQPVDSDLTAIAGLSSADSNFIVGSATGWVAESGATVRTSLGLGSAATSSTSDFAAASHNQAASTITASSFAVGNFGFYNTGAHAVLGITAPSGSTYYSGIQFHRVDGTSWNINTTADNNQLQFAVNGGDTAILITRSGTTVTGVALAGTLTAGNISATKTNNYIPKADANGYLNTWLNYGTGSGTVCAGDDSRLSNSRTPTAHQLDSATYHSVSGLTTGHVLTALSATTFGFAAQGSSHTHTASQISAGTFATGDFTFNGKIDCNGNEIEVQGTQGVTAPFIRFYRPNEEFGQIRYGTDAAHDSKFYFRNMNAASYAGIYCSTVNASADIWTSGNFGVSSSSASGSGIYLYNTSTGGKEWAWISVGSGDATNVGSLALWDDTNNAYRMIVQTNGTFLVRPGSGTTTHPYSYGLNVEVEGDYASSRIASTIYNSGAQGPMFSCYRARGTKASPTVLLANDYILSLRGFGYTGSAWAVGGPLDVLASEDWTASSAPTHTLFWSTPSGSTTRVERMRITSAGLVGIGCTPAKRLEVLDSGAAQLRLTHTANSKFSNLHVDSTGQLAVYVNSDTAADGCVASFYNSGGKYLLPYSNGVVHLGGPNNHWLYGYMQQRIASADSGYEWWNGAFTTAGYWQVMRRANSDGGWTWNKSITFTPSGLFGIGTDPTSKLHVHADTVGNSVGDIGEIAKLVGRDVDGYDGQIRIFSKRHTAGSSWSGVGYRMQHRVQGSDFTYIEFNPAVDGNAMAFGVGTTERVRFNNTGVGIGCTPASKLDVQGSVTFGSSSAITRGNHNGLRLIGTAKATPNGGGSGTIFICSDDASSQLESWISLVCSATASERRLQIGCVEQGVSWRNVTLCEGDGYVGVHTASPDRRLEVLDDTNPQLRLTQADNSKYVDFRATSDGNLVVTTGGGSWIQVFGSVYPAADNAYQMGSGSYRWADVYCADGAFNGSDSRRKTNVSPTLGLDFVMKLNPIQYKWADTKTKTYKRYHHGFVAQDVASVLEDLGLTTNDFAGYAYDDESDNYFLRYTEFIAPLVRAVQQLKTEIDSLRQQIAA